jgi:hypothetical protein
VQIRAKVQQAVSQKQVISAFRLEHLIEVLKVEFSEVEEMNNGFLVPLSVMYEQTVHAKFDSYNETLFKVASGSENRDMKMWRILLERLRRQAIFERQALSTVKSGQMNKDDEFFARRKSSRSLPIEHKRSSSSPIPSTRLLQNQTPPSSPSGAQRVRLTEVSVEEVMGSANGSQPSRFLV